MKKRAKIITTVASLCLAVALMAFGVYAANQVTFSISSQVSFTVTDIFVTIDASAQLASDEAQTMTQYKSYETEANGTKHAKAGEYDTAVTPSWDVTDIAYTSTKRVVTYVITITNDSDQDSVDADVNLVLANVEGTFRTASYVITTNGTAGQAQSFHNAGNPDPVALTAETTYGSSNGAWTFVDELTIPASASGTSSLVITLTRTLEDVSKTIAADTQSLSGSIVLTKHVGA